MKQLYFQLTVILADVRQRAITRFYAEVRPRQSPVDSCATSRVVQFCGKQLCKRSEKNTVIEYCRIIELYSTTINAAIKVRSFSPPAMTLPQPSAGRCGGYSVRDEKKQEMKLFRYAIVHQALCRLT